MGKGFIFHESDVLVIGGGAAGSMAALKARELGADVLLVDKSAFGFSGCAALASGAYITYMPGDDIRFHLKGRGDLVNQRMAERAIRATYDLLNYLDAIGVRFVKEYGNIWRGSEATSGLAASGGLSAGLVGGGPAMMKVIMSEAIRRGVKVVNRVAVTDLLTSDGNLPTTGHVIGAIGVSCRTAEIHVFQAKATVMCAGGFNFGYKLPGQPFAGMPLNVTSDGIAMELRAGAVMGNMAVGAKYLQTAEFYCAPGIEHFTLIGAKWVNRFGEDIMQRHRESEELHTRRISFASALTLELDSGRGPVTLDLTHLRPDQIRFLWDVIPIIMTTFERAGYEVSKEQVPYIAVNALVYGSSHGGGAVIDEACMTSIPGLFAAGASSDGLNISPNLNLSWCMVLGWWAGQHAAAYALQAHPVEIHRPQLLKLSAESLKYLDVRDGLDFEGMNHKASEALGELGVILTDGKLVKTKETLQGLLDTFRIGKVKAKDPHYLVKILGLKNTLEALLVVSECLLHRRESRGSIINVDHPETDNESFLAWTKCRLNGGGRLEIWDEPIPDDNYVYAKPRKGRWLHPFFKVAGGIEYRPTSSN